MEYSPAIYLCLCFRDTLRKFDSPFRGLVPSQFEPMATVAVYGHCKQSLTYEVDQGADKVDYQQDTENLQNREVLLVEVF